VVQDANSIDWHEVRRNHLPRRDPTDCRLRWQNCRDPRLEQSAFSDDEDDRLVVCAKKFGERNWEKIADALNVSNANADTATQKHKKRGLRSATQCAGRYQAFLNPTLVRSTWTPEEDAALKEFVQKKGVGRWAEAALSLPGHTHAQCLHRWGKVLCPGRRKGAWVCEEDDALRFAVAAHQRVYGRQKGPFVSPEPERLPSSSGQNAPSLAVVAPPNPHTVDSLPPSLPWSKIAAHVATRTDVQCRERWTNVLDRTVFVWTAAADTALREGTYLHFPNPADCLPIQY
jgi:myb proto-oncogene protein